MSLPLKDFRLGITEAIDIWLESDAEAFGTDKAFVARQVLQEWAKRKAHGYKVAARRMAANGLQPELDGFAPADGGLVAADAGVSRSSRK